MITTSPVPAGENPPGATAPAPVHKPAPSPLPGSGPQPPGESASAAKETIRGGPAPDSYRPPGWQPVFERVLKMIIESRDGKVPDEDVAEVTRLADTFALHILANWPRYGTGWV